MNKRSRKIAILLLVIFCSNMFSSVFAKTSSSIEKTKEYMAKSAVSVSVQNKPKVDIMLSSKDTNVNLDNFEDDIKSGLEQAGVNTSDMVFQTVDRAVLSTNASGASEIFNQWGRIGVTGNWSLTTYSGTNVIYNAANTNGATGFYSQDNYNIKDVTIEFDMRTTDSDDDYIGVFLRFNLTEDSTSS